MSPHRIILWIFLPCYYILWYVLLHSTISRLSPLASHREGETSLKVKRLQVPFHASISSSDPPLTFGDYRGLLNIAK